MMTDVERDYFESHLYKSVAPAGTAAELGRLVRQRLRQTVEMLVDLGTTLDYAGYTDYMEMTVKGGEHLGRMLNLLGQQVHSAAETALLLEAKMEGEW